MARRRTYELVIVFDAASDNVARTGADAAWYAVDRTKGAAVVEAVVHERLVDGRVREPEWPGWDQEATIAVRVQYLEP